MMPCGCWPKPEAAAAENAANSKYTTPRAPNPTRAINVRVVRCTVDGSGGQSSTISGKTRQTREGVCEPIVGEHGLVPVGHDRLSLRFLDRWELRRWHAARAHEKRDGDPDRSAGRSQLRLTHSRNPRGFRVYEVFWRRSGRYRSYPTTRSRRAMTRASEFYRRSVPQRRPTSRRDGSFRGD